MGQYERTKSIMLYSMIMADPPWVKYEPGRRTSYTSDSGEWYGDGHILSLDELCKMDIPATRDSCLFIWSKASNIDEAIHIMNAWGFKFVTQLIWVKVTKDKNKVAMGLGRRIRVSHEHLLLGTRGSPPMPKDRSILSVFFAPRLGKGGWKPNEAYDIAEKLSDGPYLELFARRRRNGWHAWGNQVPGGNDIEINMKV